MHTARTLPLHPGAAGPDDPGGRRMRRQRWPQLSGRSRRLLLHHRGGLRIGADLLAGGEPVRALDRADDHRDGRDGPRGRSVAHAPRPGLQPPAHRRALDGQRRHQLGDHRPRRHRADKMRVEERRDRNHSHFMPAPTSLAFGADETNDAAVNPALARGHLRHLPGVAQRRQRLHGSGVLVERSVGLRGPQRDAGLAPGHAPPEPGVHGHCLGGRGQRLLDVRRAQPSISRYDFQQDHGVGNDNHDDGLIWRYGAGQVKAVPNVPSHLHFRAEDQMVYVADTGNGRVVKLAASSGSKAGPLGPKQDEAESWQMSGAPFTEVVPPGHADPAERARDPGRAPLCLGQRHRSDPQVQARRTPAWPRSRPTPSRAAWRGWPSGRTGGSISSIRWATACCGSTARSESLQHRHRREGDHAVSDGGGGARVAVAVALVAAERPPRRRGARRQRSPPADSSTSPRSQVRYSRVPGVWGMPDMAAPGGSSMRSISRPAMVSGSSLRTTTSPACGARTARSPGSGGRCAGAARSAPPAAPAAPGRPPPAPPGWGWRRPTPGWPRWRAGSRPGGRSAAG